MGEGAKTSDAILAGGVAGGVSRLLTAPLDLIKIRFQLQYEPTSFQRLRSMDTVMTPKYDGFTKGVRTIFREEGLVAFWRGNVAASILWVSYSGLQFGCFRFLSTQWSEAYTGRHGTLVNTINGLVAGSVATVCTYPFDMMRTVLASQGLPRVYPTMFSLARATVHSQGIQGLFHGVTPSIIQIAPYMGISFAIYEGLKKRHWKERAATPHLVVSSLYGGVAGLVSKLAVYPLDTIKKRLQVQHVHQHPSARSFPSYRGMVHCSKQIFQHEGIFGFYKGTLPSLIKSVLTHASTFAVYEWSLLIIESFRRE